MSSRYTLDTHYGLIGIIWILIYSFWDKGNFKINKKEINKMIVPILIIVFIIGGQIWANLIEWKIGPYRKIYLNGLKTVALKRDLTDLNGLKLFQKPDIELVIRSLEFLDKYKLNVFIEK